jgi:hypothetical protein
MFDLDGFLIRLRSRKPILGWALTILAMPFALLAGLAVIWLGLGLSGLISIIGIALAALWLALSIAGKYKEEFSLERVLEGPSGTVIMVLVIIVVVSMVLLIVAIKR